MPQRVLLQILTSSRLIKVPCLLRAINLLVKSTPLQETYILHFGLPINPLGRARDPPSYERILAIVDTVRNFAVTKSLVKLINCFNRVKRCFNLSKAIRC